MTEPAVTPTPSSSAPGSRLRAGGEDGALTVLDDAALRRWLLRARNGLGRHRQRLDALNVYPVPDGDTGTNMYLTLDAGLTGLLEALVEHGREGDAALGIVAGASALARSALFSARGNSGVILSQLVAGLAAAFAHGAQRGTDTDVVGVDGPLMAEALVQADARARRALTEPVEGTILTVARAAARAARQQVEDGRASLSEVVDAACEAAHAELRATPRYLDTLARAGVVDAGGAGYVVLLDALHAVVHDAGEDDGPGDSDDTDDTDEGERAAMPGAPHAARHDFPSYEVMYLLDGVADHEAESLRRALADLGDSVLVAGDVHLRTVHVHTDEPGPAVEAGLRVGRPYGVRIHLLEADGPSATPPASSSFGAACASDGDQAASSVAAGAASEQAPAIGFVACVQAPKLVALFEESGAVVVADAPGRRVTPAHLAAAAHATGAPRVVVLPDDEDSVLAAIAARELAQEQGIELSVIPTGHLLQGLAALTVADATDPSSEERMRAAAEGMRCGVVATATSAATTTAGPCEPGDVLGFVGDTVTHVARSRRDVAVQVISALVRQDSELVTLVEGENGGGLGDEVSQALGDSPEATLNGLEVTVLDGGQSVYDLLVGVE